MTSRLLARLLCAALVAQRLGEIRLAKDNERLAVAAGAVEFGRSHYAAFWVLHPVWLAGLLWESRHETRSPQLGWLGLALLAQPVRMMTMRALGPQWTTRVLVTPEAEPVTTGLYRLTAHPAYLAVTAELLAAPLAARAWRTASLGSLANAALLLAFRLPAERAAMRSRHTPPDTPVHRSNPLDRSR